MSSQSNKQHEAPQDISTRTPVLIAEYQKAQDSAQHHDTLVWSCTSIVWSGNLVLLGFVGNNLERVAPRPLLIIACVVAFALDLMVWMFALQFNSVKRQKYNRCKEIEAVLGMRQHSELKFAGGAQRIVYAAVMLVFLMLWTITALLLARGSASSSGGVVSSSAEPPKVIAAGRRAPNPSSVSQIPLGQPRRRREIDLGKTALLISVVSLCVALASLCWSILREFWISARVRVVLDRLAEISSTRGSVVTELEFRFELQQLT